MWVKLNAEGMKTYGGIFPDGTVPVYECGFVDVDPGTGGVEPCAIVDIERLQTRTLKLLCEKLGELSNVSANDVERAIKKDGLPIRKSMTTGFAAIELRFLT